MRHSSYPRSRRWRAIVSAPTKRRHALYYLSLPLVIAIVFVLVAQLAAWQRAEIVAELADRVAHQETHEASAALRQLAGMPRPPLHILVAAATSADPVVADEAQRQIGGLLRRWKRKLDEERGVRAVSRRLSELAALLAREQSNFDVTEHRWLANTSRRILKLSNRVPSRQSPLVAAHCDAILAAIANGEASALAFAERGPSRRQRVVMPVAAPADLVDEGQPSPALLEREVPELTATESGVFASPLSQLDHADGDQQNVGPLSDEAYDAKSTHDGGEEVFPDRPWLGAAESPWRAEWAHPLLRTLPAVPIKSSSTSSDSACELPPPSEFVPVPADSERGRQTLMKIDSRQLLERWLYATHGEVLALEEELARRGFARLPAGFVAQLVSDDPEERLQLVEDLILEPGIDARAWLILLAEDRDADVRLSAVSVMATSSDAVLLEKAWLVAIHDGDPRIANLASRLRERRSTERQ